MNNLLSAQLLYLKMNGCILLYPEVQSQVLTSYLNQKLQLLTTPVESMQAWKMTEGLCGKHVLESAMEMDSLVEFETSSLLSNILLLIQPNV